jgi:hypothetical protein
MRKVAFSHARLTATFLSVNIGDAPIQRAIIEMLDTTVPRHKQA